MDTWEEYIDKNRDVISKQKIRRKIEELEFDFKILDEEIKDKTNDMAYQNTKIFHRNMVKILNELIGEE